MLWKSVLYITSDFKILCPYGKAVSIFPSTSKHANIEDGNLAKLKQQGERRANWKIWCLI